MLDLTINILISVVAAIFVVWVHELSKHYMSLVLYHPIHRKRLDIRVNPIKFIDPIGLILFVFSGIGWQFPAEYNTSKFKDKEKGLLILSVTGIGANILVILAMIPLLFNLNNPSTQVGMYIFLFVARIMQFSFALIIVNLLPVPPLDMTKIIYALNPSFYFKMIQNQRIIQAVFILLVAFGIINLFVNSIYEPIITMFL